MSHLKLLGESPTGVFPWQVWQSFLKVLEEIGGEQETEVGLNILNASTELQKIFKKEKAFFALKKVIRFLFENKWIDLQDLLNLRLLSKNLNSSIHSFINETRRAALFEAYDPDEHGKVMDSRHLRMDRAFCDPHSQFVGFRLHETVDRVVDEFEENQSIDGVTEFQLDLVQQKKTGGFPFTMATTVPLLVTRSASVRLVVSGNGPDFDNDELAEQVSSFFTRVSSVLSQLGNQVWSLNFSYDFSVDDFQDGIESEINMLIWSGLLKLLHNLGNLKHLRIDGRGLYEVWVNGGDWVELLFPSVPQLESIEVEVAPFIADLSVFDATTRLITHFSPQLRRLSIPIRGYWSLSPDRLRNLTEVEILESGRLKRGQQNGILRKFLDNLKAPLVRLKLELVREDKQHLALRKGVIHWLKQFPTLQSLHVLTNQVYLEETNEGEGPSFPNLRVLKMEDWGGGLTYQFLRRLPSLQYLELAVRPLPSVWEDSAEDWPGIVKFKEELREGQLYESNVWGLLPELKSITVRITKGSSRTIIRFFRERYERLKLGKKKMMNAETVRKEVEDRVCLWASLPSFVS